MNNARINSVYIGRQYMWDVLIILQKTDCDVIMLYNLNLLERVYVSRFYFTALNPKFHLESIVLASIITTNCTKSTEFQSENCSSVLLLIAWVAIALLALLLRVKKDCHRLFYYTIYSPHTFKTSSDFKYELRPMLVCSSRI